MEGLNVRRLVWMANRWILMKGPAVWVGLVGGIIVLGMVVAVMLSLARLSRVDEALANHGRQAPMSLPSRSGREAPALPLPGVERRFDVTARILAAVSESGLEPEQIQFKFETSEDARFIRQTAVFTLRAEWTELSRALQLLQATDRSVYISRLRLIRETADQAIVSAEVQLAVAFTDSSLGQGARP